MLETLTLTASAPDRVPAAGLAVRSEALTSLAALDAAMANGFGDEWAAVVEHDPLASLFQTPGWCMPWYRIYADTFDPYVIVVSAGDRPVGIVPMAVERATRALVFASHTMADYRDIVALPGYREAVVSELLRHYTEHGFASPLQIGWIDPASDTPALVARACAARRLRSIVRRQPCWRWFPPAPSKPSAQKFLNWYLRSGKVVFEVVDSVPAWERFRDEYYPQHTLRQIQTGRQTAFDDPRRVALYEAFFHSRDIQRHVTALRHNGVMLAGHFGYVWRGVLLLGPPSIRLEDEQRSPAVILLSWIIQNADALGLKGFDLTIGESDFKQRLGNQCVELSTIEVYASAGAYHLHSSRDAAVAAMKRLVERRAGPDAWKTLVKPRMEALAFERALAGELGVAGALRRLGAAVRRCFYERAVARTYVLTPESVGAAGAGAGESVRVNAIEDLLLWKGTSPTTARALTTSARTYARGRGTGRVLHTLVVDGALAGWCFSSTSNIHDGFILPAFRGSAASGTLLRAAARHRFDGGSGEVRLTIPGDDNMFGPAASSTGRLASETAVRRVFRSARLWDTAERLWRRLTWRAVRRRIALAFHYDAEERTYRLTRDDAADLPASDDIARDRWDDLALFVPSEPRHSRDACLEDWRQRRARGEHVYTHVEDGRLVAYGWVVERQKTMRLDWVKQSEELPDGSAVIYDFYTLPEYRHRDFYQRLLMHAMQDAARMPGIQWICLSILASDQVPRWWVERMGMQLRGRYFYRRVLWMAKVWSAQEPVA